PHPRGRLLPALTGRRVPRRRRAARRAAERLTARYASRVATPSLCKRKRRRCTSVSESGKCGRRSCGPPSSKGADGSRRGETDQTVRGNSISTRTRSLSLRSFVVLTRGNLERRFEFSVKNRDQSGGGSGAAHGGAGTTSSLRPKTRSKRADFLRADQIS